MNDSKNLGVYETMRSFNGVFALLPEHQARLAGSCKEMGFECPDLAEVAAPFRGRRDVRLHTTVSAAGVKMLDSELPDWEGSFLHPETWKVKLFEGERKITGMKTTNITMQQTARLEAEKGGYGEVLLVDGEGRIREGSITNVFFVKGGVAGEKIITPGEGVLPGISRRLILRACGELGIEVELRDVSAKEFLRGDFDTAFLSNAVRGMISTGKVMPVMERIAGWCEGLIKNRINEHAN